MINIKKNTLSRLLLILPLIIISCQEQGTKKVIKLAHELDVNHSVHKAMIYMGKVLQKKSNNRLSLDIYPGGQLGSERELVELLQIGSLAMTKVSAASLESFVPEMQVFGIPYLFRDDEHRWKVLNGPIGKNLLLTGEPFFLRGMGYYDSGCRSFYTKEKPINKPGDLSGMKIRTMKSITSVEMIKTLGGAATPIPWGELYTSLQQGVVDGAENNPPSFYLSRHYEVCKYYSIDEHTAIPDVLVMSTVVWKTLTPQEQKWLQESVDESVTYQKQLWKAATDSALREVVKAGVHISYPDKTPFIDAVKKYHTSFNGTIIQNLIAEITELK